MGKKRLTEKELKARSLGGRARARKLSKAQRSESARKAGLAKGRKYRRLLALEKRLKKAAGGADSR